MQTIHPTDALDTKTRLLVFTLLLLVSGCSYFRNLHTSQRDNRGLTIVLPGIEGESVFNSNIAQGLVDGGVETSIEVHDWTTGNTSDFLRHLQDRERNRLEAKRLAAKIVRYQNKHPDKPVWLLGHSGGGGLSLLTLEELPQGRTITGAILIAAAVSPDYDLQPVLDKTQAGIWNFSSQADSLALGAGTTIVGTIDGKYTASAGMVGFEWPVENDVKGDSNSANKLHEVPYRPEMLQSGNIADHFGPTGIDFSRDYFAPIIRNHK